MCTLKQEEIVLYTYLTNCNFLEHIFLHIVEVQSYLIKDHH